MKKNKEEAIIKETFKQMYIIIEASFQICAKQHRLWGRLYFPSLAAKISPIPNALLHCDPTIPINRQSLIFLPLNLSCFRGLVESSETQQKQCYQDLHWQGQKKSCSFHVGLWKCSPDTPPWVVLCQSPAAMQWEGQAHGGAMQTCPGR